MPTVILRSLVGRIGTVLVALAVLYPVMVIWLADGYGNGLKALAVAAVVVLAAWLLWWRPHAVVAEEAIEVRNAFRSHHVPWELLRGTRTRWGLVLEIDEAAAAATDSAAPIGTVNVSACQRGGVFTAARHERRAVHVDEAYVTATVTDPSDSSADMAVAEPRVFRTHMDAFDAAHLMEMYRAARAEHRALTRRLRRRAQRLGKLPAGSMDSVDRAGSTYRAGTAAQQPDVSGLGLRTRWDRAPIVATVAVLVLLAAVLIAL